MRAQKTSRADLQAADGGGMSFHAQIHPTSEEEGLPTPDTSAYPSDHVVAPKKDRQKQATKFTFLM